MALHIEENVPLKEHSTMRVGGPARYFATISNQQDLTEALQFAKQKSLPIFVLGGGSNVVFLDAGHNGLVIACRIKGFSVVEETEKNVVIKVGSGEVWDDVVSKSVEMNLSGIEAMPIVPGLVGAAPIHNIGCYGQEVSGTIIQVTAYDLQRGEVVTFTNQECKFGYRTSRFDKEDRGKYVILDVSFRLNKEWMQPPFYKDVEEYFKENNISEYSPAKIREAVIAIRQRKLPDPNVVANAGSFFRNVIVPRVKFDAMVAKVPSLNETPPGWPQPPRWFLSDGNVKIAAARLVELAGFSAYEDRETGMATWPKQNLVFVNKGARSASDVMTFRDKVATAVREMFDIELENEVEIIGT